MADRGRRPPDRSAERLQPHVPDGILLIAKEPGPTSHDIVGLVRRLTGVRRVGHGGTLDPFAAGVLPVFVGHATRLAEYHFGDDKEYRALVAFGARSTTDDLEGEVTPTDAQAPDRAAVEEALPGFLGRIEQVPPDYSAVHVGGRRAYELARHGKKPELRPRTVTIHSLTLTDWQPADGQRPTAMIEVRCSAGTYIRSLARDLGERLRCGAYLAALTRTASGPFRLADARSLNDIRAALAEGGAAEVLLPPDAGLDVPRVTLAGRELAALLKGQAVAAPKAHAEGEAPDLVRVSDDRGRLAAIARVRGGRLHPDKVLLPPTAEPG